MKKITFLAFLFVAVTNLHAQFLQGSFTKDASDPVNLKIAFKIKATANMASEIAYLEAAFRFPTATTPSFTISNISSNTTDFAGLDVQRFTPDYNSDGFTYFKFVFNTSVLASKSYNAGTEYNLFSITTSLPAASTPAFEMISNLVLGDYHFGAVNGSGDFINPGSADMLYGPGFYRSGNDHILPLFGNGALPVTFSSFTVQKKNNDALLIWQVENQDANTSHYEIERSPNGINFSRIDKIMADHSGGNRASYSATDRNIKSLGMPVIYYRIKQVDHNGQYVYTTIKMIRPDAKGFESIVYPNPGYDKVKLSFYLTADQIANVTLFDVNGRTVKMLRFIGAKGFNQQTIDISLLPAGTYQLRLQAGDITETTRLVKTD